MGGTKSDLVGYFDAPADKPTVVEFVDDMEPRTTISILPYGLASAQTVNKVGADARKGRGWRSQWVEVEGPLHETWPPESHRRIFGDLAQVPARCTTTATAWRWSRRTPRRMPSASSAPSSAARFGGR